MPQERYESLPEETRKFLAELREPDIRDLESAVDLARSTRTVARIVRWFFVAAISTFIAAASLGNSVAQLAKWLHIGDSK